jgi:hypothetical protein
MECRTCGCQSTAYKSECDRYIYHRRAVLSIMAYGKFNFLSSLIYLSSMELEIYKCVFVGLLLCPTFSWHQT